MQLNGPKGTIVYHDVRDSFGPLLREVLLGGGFICAALGPIYENDPAEKLLLPFVRADVETGWSSRPRYPDGLPEHITRRARELRQNVVDAFMTGEGSWYLDVEHDRTETLDDWTRAGLVLEVCRRRGVNVRGLGKAHVNWRLRGTETGRFGASHTTIRSSAFQNGFNPLTIPKADRELVVPSAGGRLVCVIDFKAIDLCSMLKLVPGLIDHYDDAWDPHGRTAEILGGERVTTRDEAKEQIFVHAYGGNSKFKEVFEATLPELDQVRRLPHGEFPRRVQSLSAKAFRAGLARALPKLLGDDVIPMFTVHDELVLDITDGSVDAALDVANVMQEAATERVGVKYTTSVGLGLNYGKAKE